MDVRVMWVDTGQIAGKNQEGLRRIFRIVKKLAVLLW